MSYTEGSRLAAFAEAVRGSTLKRLSRVPDGSENWRVAPDAMSFADLARHLIDVDDWLFKMLQAKNLPPVHGCPGAVTVAHRDEYVRLMDELKRTGQERHDVLERLSEEQLRDVIDDVRFGGTVTAWWVVMRGNLDHEIHHRGQISAYLKMLEMSGQAR
jgi:uncharacterized damage-inducible protein DinB